MRATLGDAVRHPSYASAWWIDLPMRRRVWWRQLLLEPGSGWMRWRGEYVADWQYLAGGRYDAGGVVCYPPARRVWQYLIGHLRAPYYMLREHLSWEEVTFSWSDLPTDPDRKRLWQ